MSGCFPSDENQQWTICGKCNMRVAMISVNDHNCDIIQQLKSNLSYSLAAIQQEYRARLDKLESHHIDQLSPYAYVTLNTKIKELESKIDTINFLPELINRAVKVFQNNDGLKPHKCPVCDGKVLSELQIVRTESGKDKLVIECHACEGKGIIWG